MPESINQPRIGLVVNSGPSLGYGHAIRCQRIARAFQGEAAIYPISEACRRYFELAGFADAIRDWKAESFLPVMVTDLREAHAVREMIPERGSVHVSIHDMGLAQCPSDVAIDGSVTNVVPYPPNPNQTLFLGPQYAITRPPVARAATADLEDTILVTLGGGASAEFAGRLADQLQPLGIQVVTTAGFGPNTRTPPTPDSEIERVMSRCRFAICTAGVSLYDLLASGVPTIAVALDRLQLQTADAFAELGATMSAGLLDRLSPAELLDQCRELLGNGSKASRMISIGQDLVDGKGLSRVVDIIGNPGRGLWKTHQTQTSTAC